MTIDCATETPGEFAQELSIRTHKLRADVSEEEGGHDSAPNAHDIFDAALAACKTLTATWYAKKKGIALERVEAHVERDSTEERAGKYKLRVRLEFHGALSDDDKKRLHAAVAKCPVQKLMTTTEVSIETEEGGAH